MPATLVQSSGARSGNGTTQSWTWAAAPTVGNVIIVKAVGWASPTGPTASCADAASNSYTQRTNELSTGSGATTTRAAIFDCVIASSPSSTTVTWSVSSDHSVVFEEWSGLDTASLSDQVATPALSGLISGSGSRTLTVGPTGTLAQANELVQTLLGAATGLAASNIATPSGYTGGVFEQNSPSFIGMGSAYKTVAATTAVDATWPFDVAGGAGQTAVALLATYRIASPPPTITAQPTSQTANSGATATFSVTSPDATSYQWQINSSGTWTNVSTGTGGTTSSYTTGTLGTADNGSLYRCQVTNIDGTVNSAEVFVFLTNQPSASKGRRLSSTWFDHKSTTKGYTNPFIQLRKYSRAANAVNPAASTAWNTWWFDAVASGASGTLSYTNANDTSSAAGTTTVIGTLARTNANDTSAASGTTAVVGTLARTNANDTLSASGSVGSPVSGTLAYTNNNDTLAANGNTTVLATSSTTNANDTSSSAGSPVVNGSVNYTNNNDTLVAIGTTAIVGSLSTTNANDTLAALGTAGSTPAGTVNYTNQNDTSSAQGTSIIQGTLTRTNNNDTLTASGTAGNPVVGITTRLPMTGVGS